MHDCIYYCYWYENLYLSAENIFGINERSGEVFALSNLDRETKDFYEIKIIAKDGGRKQLSSFAKLKIHVVDINDNSPNFYPKEYFVVLPPNNSPSSRLHLDEAIVTVFASDKDDGLNAKVRYNWDTSNDLTQNQLRLNTETGEVFPRRSFSLSRDNLLNDDNEIQAIEVFATDGGGRRSPESAIIYLYPNEAVYPNGPLKMFQKTSLEFAIVEDNSLVDAHNTLSRRQGKKESIYIKI